MRTIGFVVFLVMAMIIHNRAYERAMLDGISGQAQLVAGIVIFWSPFWLLAASRKVEKRVYDFIGYDENSPDELFLKKAAWGVITLGTCFLYGLLFGILLACLRLLVLG